MCNEIKRKNIDNILIPKPNTTYIKRRFIKAKLCQQAPQFNKIMVIMKGINVINY